MSQNHHCCLQRGFMKIPGAAEFKSKSMQQKAGTSDLPEDWERPYLPKGTVCDLQTSEGGNDGGLGQTVADHAMDCSKGNPATQGPLRKRKNRAHGSNIFITRTRRSDPPRLGNSKGEELVRGMTESGEEQPRFNGMRTGSGKNNGKVSGERPVRRRKMRIPNDRYTSRPQKTCEQKERKKS